MLTYFKVPSALPNLTDKDQLWTDIYRSLYNVWIEEKAEEWLLDFWSRVNTIASLLVSLTSSGSALAGLALWANPAGKTAWAWIAGLAALMSVLTSVFSVSNSVKSHSEYRAGFLRLRLAAESLIQDLPMVSVDEGRQQFVELRTKVNALIEKAPHDLALTKARRAALQDELEGILVSKGYSDR